ncbi:DUF6328 family protein [Streptomyces uncialis]|uniref:DUF6328 family protein n=1 Tax=Streptomyces uncialis TaxID=1048205 RepID=UPI002E2ECBC2|nr:DUF6328 family protein [Streptomyces uncialis]WTE09653.1 DUF6328 family protein [Streptomyces uncialis]
MPADPTRPGRTGDPRTETPVQRADRNFGELLQELRVTQTGVQILFAFLLTLAFTPRFPDLDRVQRVTYVVALCLSVLAAALFTAPAAIHRYLFHQGVKSDIVRVSSRLTELGLGVLCLALSGSVLLAVDVAVGRTGGLVAGGATLLVCAALWVVLPWHVQRVVATREATDRTGPPAGTDDGGEPS